MDEKDVNSTPEQPHKAPVTYASPVKRLWAWVGVVYMVILVLFSTYSMARGHALTGTAGLLLSPALVGLGGTALLRYRQGMGRGGLWACILVAGGAFALAVWNLIQGVPVLLSQL